MTWLVVARRDVREFRADDTLTYFGAFLGLLGAGIAFAATRGRGAPPLPSTLSVVFTFAVPLTAVTLTHESIPSRVASGRIRLTLSLPHTRTEYVVGVGAAALASTLLVTGVAVAAAAVVYAVRGGQVAPLRLAGAFALAALLAAAFVAGSLAFTARSRSATLSTATGYGFFLLSFLWPAVVAVVEVVLAGQFRVAVPDAVRTAAVHASPIFAFAAALPGVGVDGGFSPAVGSIPAWAGLLVLLAWAAAGTVLAAGRFDTVDL
ncbi:MAG: ABC transporter permease subunit [Halobacterium sp.]